MVTWAELAGRSLARQFPTDIYPGDVTALIGRIGPLQTQTARAAFLGAAARLPGVTKQQVTAAYESWAIVRGSTLRGTVHTSTPELHALLEAATRVGQRSLWQRSLKPERVSLEQIWAGIEAFAADQWRTPTELAEHLRGWLAQHDPGARPSFSGTSERYFAFGHGGLIRRPIKGDWAGQGAPEYRTAAAVVGDRSAVLADSDAALDALFVHQIGAAGPLSRNDLAWWAGVGLTRVDQSLARLGLPGEPGPDGRIYHDLPDGAGPASVPGVRLLPEFDALFCAFDPASRVRFVDAEHYDILWKQDNGLLLAPVLLDDRLRGHWRLSGTGRRRVLEITWFPGARRIADDQLPVSAVEAALDVAVSAVRTERL